MKFVMPLPTRRTKSRGTTPCMQVVSHRPFSTPAIQLQMSTKAIYAVKGQAVTWNSFSSSAVRKFWQSAFSKPATSCWACTRLFPLWDAPSSSTPSAMLLLCCLPFLRCSMISMMRSSTEPCAPKQPA